MHSLPKLYWSSHPSFLFDKLDILKFIFFISQIKKKQSRLGVTSQNDCLHFLLIFKIRSWKRSKTLSNSSKKNWNSQLNGFAFWQAYAQLKLIDINLIGYALLSFLLGDGCGWGNSSLLKIWIVRKFYYWSWI